ncbi:MAG TPA: SDR family NAD(P)-dependent oxidoreductase, partial [Kaistiaceae bacterium]|nr:SDR family NAD(P)-dependent oxidoreductase [Kaistiaceae bacterium]
MSLSTPKAALVTGAARRVGRAIAEDLAANGHAVAIHCNSSADEAEAVAAGIRARGGIAAVVCADLADHGAIAGLVPAAA